MNIQIQRTKLDQLQTSFLPFFIETTKEELSHINISLQSIGQISPIVMLTFKNKLFLVDGYKRAACFKEQQKSIIETKVIYCKTSQEAFDIILASHFNRIMESGIHKCQLLKLFFTKHDDTKALQQQLGLPIQNSFWLDLEHILALPNQALSFFHHKKYSFKQLIFFSKIKPVIITSLLDLFPTMTSQQFEKTVSQILDLEKRNKGFFEEFKSSDALQDILSKKEPSLKNKALLIYLDTLSYPIKHKTLKKIKKQAQPIEIDLDSKLSWDETLEHKYINITKKIKSKTELDGFIVSLSKQKTYLKDLFDVL